MATLRAESRRVGVSLSAGRSPSIGSQQGESRYRRKCRIEPLERRELLAADSSFAVPLSAMADFNGDSISDILWENQSTGQISVWRMSNGSVVSKTNIGSVDTARWKIVGLGDFDGDRTADILWQDQTNGIIGTWIIRNGAVSRWSYIGGADPAQWRVAGVGDFDGDGTADILWHNQITGALGTYILRDGAFSRWSYIGGADPAQWRVAGVSDFDGDRTADILWQNQSTGVVGVWGIRSGAIQGWTYIGSTDPAVWEVAGAGDFDGDRIADILWQNQVNGAVGTWIVKNGAIQRWSYMGGANVAAWDIAGLGDFDSDGVADVLWHGAEGDNGAWIIKDAVSSRWSSLGRAEQTGIQNAQLANLFGSLIADGSIGRNDMMQLMRSTVSDGSVVDAVELNDLRYILTNAAAYQMPGYVQTLAGNVLNGNLANAQYQGQALGNLAAGSTAGQMNKLVDKWFLGADHPETSYTYQYFAGSLFVNGPAYNDCDQGYLGDCYFIASLDAIAKSSPTAIQNMFVDNGDNTWTVRFYSNGIADYVTVDRYLPSSSGYAIFADVRGVYTNGGNELWMALAEKAYAQWNETGREGRDGVNAYASIEGGWMQDVCEQVLGSTSQVYWGLYESDKQYLINSLAANKVVTYATNSNPGNGLVGPHAYVVSSYNSATGKFQLYNPWGSYQPGPLSYAQLRTNGQCFVVASASGSVPYSSLKQNAVSVPVVAAMQTSLEDRGTSQPGMKVTSETTFTAFEDTPAPRVERSQAVDRVMVADWYLDDSMGEGSLPSWSRPQEIATAEAALVADLIFAWQDALHLSCI